MAVNAKGEEITSIWTPANIVTCVRILFIPLFMVASEFAFSGFAPAATTSASPQAPGQSPPSFCTSCSAPPTRSTAILPASAVR